MNKLISILLIPLLMGLDVGETTNHQDMLLPFGNAYEGFSKEGCVSITRKKISPVTQYKADTDTIIISGQVVRITCKRPDPAPSETVDAVGVEVSWTRPTVRENGDILTPEEISHYEIFIDDQTYIAENSPWRIDLVPGVYYISMLTVDSGQLRSDITSVDEVIITLP